MIIASFRKLGLLLAELKAHRTPPSGGAMAVRSIVAQGVAVVGAAMLGPYVLVLGSALLPPINALVVLVGIVALISWML
jgi:hypothetical protein